MVRASSFGMAFFRHVERGDEGGQPLIGQGLMVAHLTPAAFPAPAEVFSGSRVVAAAQPVRLGLAQHMLDPLAQMAGGFALGEAERVEHRLYLGAVECGDRLGGERLGVGREGRSASRFRSWRAAMRGAAGR
jgi:hypothetical protein